MNRHDDNDEPVIAGRRSVAGELSALIRDEWRAILGWACVIIASLVVFGLSEGTQYHELAAGIFMSSSTLFVLTALFECLWRLLVDRNS